MLDRQGMFTELLEGVQHRKTTLVMTTRRMTTRKASIATTRHMPRKTMATITTMMMT